MKNRLLTLTEALRLPLLIPVFLLAWMSPASGDTIQNFVIQNSSDPSMPGGTFFEGGTYSGSFSLDTTLIPSNGSSAIIFLQTFNIIVTTPFVNIAGDMSSANGATAFFRTLNELSEFPGQQIDEIDFTGGRGLLSQFYIQLFEPLGIFHGGLVAFAQAQALSNFNFFDVSGSALVIDPALVPAATPEPNTGLLLVGGVCLLAALVKRLEGQSNKTDGPRS